MAREKFIYNAQTLRYEKVVESLSSRIFTIVGFICAALVTAFIFTLISHKYFPSPALKDKEKEINLLRTQYAQLGKEINKMSNALQSIQDRDASAHRMIFGMDPIDENVWNGGVGGNDKYEKLPDYSSKDVLVSTLEKVDKLKHQLALQSKSLDEILKEARHKEDMLASIPSIKPLRSDHLRRDIQLLSGFGWRTHPIHKVRKMHTGIDFSAPKGTPIQATGNGVVKEVELRSTGYGVSVLIDHGYGYQTLYAHMGKVSVKVGEKVNKGQKIGEVGSTGTSTAPHCHYEVIFKGKKINPIHYCMDGLNPEEYNEMVKAAEHINQSFD